MQSMFEVKYFAVHWQVYVPTIISYNDFIYANASGIKRKTLLMLVKLMILKKYDGVWVEKKN